MLRSAIVRTNIQRILRADPWCKLIPLQFVGQNACAVSVLRNILQSSGERMTYSIENKRPTVDA